MMMSRYPEISCTTVVASVTNRSRWKNIQDFQPVVVACGCLQACPHDGDNPRKHPEQCLQDQRCGFGTQVRGKKFVMISTDKAVNPTNGCTRSGLRTVQPERAWTANLSPHTQFVTTRFGNAGIQRFVSIFKKQIEAGGPVTVTDPNIVRLRVDFRGCKLC